MDALSRLAAKAADDIADQIVSEYRTRRTPRDTGLLLSDLDRTQLTATSVLLSLRDEEVIRQGDTAPSNPSKYGAILDRMSRYVSGRPNRHYKWWRESFVPSLRGVVERAQRAAR